LPVRAELHLMKPERAGAHEAAGLMRRRLGEVGNQPDRRGKRKAADAGIREPAFAFELDAKEEMRARRNKIARLPEPDACAQRADRETQRSQDLEEEAVLLEAVSSPAFADELALDRVKIEADAAAQQDVQVFKRNAPRVGRQDRCQRGDRG